MQRSPASRTQAVPISRAVSGSVSFVHGVATRYDALDALRGLAMVWMTMFHFCFDLSHLGLWAQNFRSDPFWTLQRTAIVTLFLACAGISQAVAQHHGQSSRHFAKRTAQVAACALLVSAGSYVMFPQSFIYFGVLHGLVVMLLIVRLTARWGQWLWVAGLVALILPMAAPYALGAWGPDATSWFNSRVLSGLGFVSRKPFTEDFVPLLPWVGIVWWGVAFGQWTLHHRPHWLSAPLASALQPVAKLGRWSLSYYMLHQPVMIGGLMAAMWLSGR